MRSRVLAVLATLNAPHLDPNDLLIVVQPTVYDESAWKRVLEHAGDTHALLIVAPFQDQRDAHTDE